MVDRSSLVVLAALVLLACLAVPVAAEDEEPSGITVTDTGNRIEFRLPAPYWDHEDRQQLADRVSGGLFGRELPPGLLHVATHKDAGAFVQINEGGRRFLMRNREDLETFVSGTVQAITEQIDRTGEVLVTDWDERDGMIIHRFSFRAQVRGGDGCMAPEAGQDEPQAMRWLFVDFFMRPEGEDAVNFQMRYVAPDEVYEALIPELDFIESSFHYTGPLAEEFFVPDAPAERVPTAGEAAEAVADEGGLPTWLLLLGVGVVIWMLMKRKKEQPAT